MTVISKILLFAGVLMASVLSAGASPAVRDHHPSCDAYDANNDHRGERKVLPGYTTELDFSESAVVTSTLDRTGGELRYESIATTSTTPYARNAIPLDLVVTVVDDGGDPSYLRGERKRGDGRKAFGSISIRKQPEGSRPATLRFCLVRTGTNRPVVVDRFAWTVYDLDKRASTGIAEQLRMDVSRADHYKLSPTTEIAVSCDDEDATAEAAATGSQPPPCPAGVRTVFEATANGNGGDNPTDPRALTVRQRNRAVGFVFTDTSCWDVGVRTSEADHPSERRGFVLFSGTSSVLEEEGRCYPTTITNRAPSPDPSTSPSNIPSNIPSTGPSAAPSMVPSLAPSDDPSANPTAIPSSAPSGGPSRSPTNIPSNIPSTGPSAVPSMVPSLAPTDDPSANPTAVPSSAPSGGPSPSPTSVPSTGPSAAPSMVPSLAPSDDPSANPTAIPSSAPSGGPSPSPTSVPSSLAPTEDPSGNPTATAIAPTATPTNASTATATTMTTTAYPTASVTGTSTGRLPRGGIRGCYGIPTATCSQDEDRLDASTTGIPTTASTTGFPTAAPTGTWWEPPLTTTTTIAPTGTPTTDGIATAFPTTAPTEITSTRGPAAPGIRGRCPSDVSLLKRDGVTDIDLLRAVRILRQDTGTVTVRLANAWTPKNRTPDERRLTTNSVESIFYSYRRNAFDEKCYQTNDVPWGAVYDDVTIRCFSSKPIAELSICLSDSSEVGGVLDRTGDTARPPKCCHSDRPENTPSVCYKILVRCEPSCNNGSNEDDGDRVWLRGGRESSSSRNNNNNNAV